MREHKPTYVYIRISQTTEGVPHSILHIFPTRQKNKSTGCLQFQNIFKMFNKNYHHLTTLHFLGVTWVLASNLVILCSTSCTSFPYPRQKPLSICAIQVNAMSIPVSECPRLTTIATICSELDHINNDTPVNLSSVSDLRLNVRIMRAISNKQTGWHLSQLHS